MKEFIKIIVLSAFSFTLNAQSYFNKLYDFDSSGIYNNAGASVYEHSNGDFLITGQKFYSFSYGALFFIKINSNGDTIYSKRYPKNNCQYYCGASGSLIKCFDGNLAQSGAFVDNAGNFDALLVKLTADGDTLWTKIFGGPGFDAANIVCQTVDSGFVLMGVKENPIMPPASDFYLIKTNKYGVFQWEQTYGTTATDDDCISGQVTLDGGYLMSGRESNLFHIVKTDSVGNLQWQQTYAGTAGVCFIKQLADSSYILTGAKTIAGLGYQAYMIKINKSGGITWQNDYGGIEDNWFYTMPIILSDGSIVAAGQSMVGSVPIGMLIKTDSVGNQKWLRTYYANPSNDNYVYDVKQTSDNGFILVGSGNLTGQDAWVVKVDSAGCEIANCNLGVNEFQITDFKLQLYPNPASNEINILIEGEDLNNYEISILNVLGEIQSVKYNSFAIAVSQLSPGIYFISATSKDGKHRFIEKFVKE